MVDGASSVRGSFASSVEVLSEAVDRIGAHGLDRGRSLAAAALWLQPIGARAHFRRNQRCNQPDNSPNSEARAQVRLRSPDLCGGGGMRRRRAQGAGRRAGPRGSNLCA